MPDNTHDNTQALNDLLRAEAELYAYSQQHIKDPEQSQYYEQLLRQDGILISQYQHYLNQLDELQAYYEKMQKRLEPQLLGQNAVKLGDYIQMLIEEIQQKKADTLPVNSIELERYKEQVFEQLQNSYRQFRDKMSNLWISYNQKIGDLQKSVSEVLNKGEDPNKPYSLSGLQSQKKQLHDWLPRVSQLRENLDSNHINFYERLLEYNDHQAQWQKYDQYHGEAKQLISNINGLLDSLTDYVTKKKAEDSHGPEKLAIAEQLRNNLFQYLTNNDYGKADLSEFFDNQLGEGYSQTTEQKIYKKKLLSNKGKAGRLKKLLLKAKEDVLRKMPEHKPVTTFYQQRSNVMPLLDKLDVIRGKLNAKGADSAMSATPEEHIKQTQEFKGFAERYPDFMKAVLPEGYSWEQLSQAKQAQVIGLVAFQNTQGINVLSDQDKQAIAQLSACFRDEETLKFDQRFQLQAVQASEAFVNSFPKRDWRQNIPSTIESHLKQIGGEDSQQLTVLQQIQRCYQAMLANPANNQDDDLIEKLQAYTQAFCDYAKTALQDEEVTRKVSELPAIRRTNSSVSIEPNNDAGQFNIFKQTVDDALNAYKNQNHFKEKARQNRHNLDEWVESKRPAYKKLKNAQQRQEEPENVGQLARWVFSNLGSSWRNKKNQPFSLQVKVMDCFSYYLGKKCATYGATNRQFSEAVVSSQDSSFERQMKKNKCVPEIWKNYFKSQYLGEHGLSKAQPLIDNVVDIVYKHLYKSGKRWKKFFLGSKGNDAKGEAIFNSLDTLLNKKLLQGGVGIDSITQSVKLALQSKKDNQGSRLAFQQDLSGESEVQDFVSQLDKHTGFFSFWPSKETTTAKQLRQSLEKENNIESNCTIS